MQSVYVHREAINDALTSSDLVYPKKLFIEMVKGASENRATGSEAVGLLQIMIKGVGYALHNLP
jgi:hypothetical protein